MNNQPELARKSLYTAIELAGQHEVHQFSGLAYLNLARYRTVRGELFEAFQMLKKARQNFQRTQPEKEAGIALHYEANIYRQLQMPRHTREASLKAARIFGEKKLVIDCMEAYLTAIDTALSEKRLKLARQLLDVCSPMLAEASPNLNALWRCYDAHPLLQRTKKQRYQASQTIQECATKLEVLGNMQYALSVRLFGAQLAVKLRQKDAVVQYKAIINQAHKQEMPHIEQQANVELARLQRSKESETTLRRAADILVETRWRMPIEELKANLLTSQMDIYVQLIEAQLKNHNETSAAQTLMEAKGGIWSDFIQRARLSEEPAQDDDWVRAKTELSYWQEQLRLALQEGNHEETPLVTQYKIKVELAKDTLEWLNRTRSHITQDQQPSQALPNISDIQQWLQAYEQQTQKRMLLLDYFVGTSHVYVCLISADNMQWIELGQSIDIKQWMYRLDILLEAILVCDTSKKRQATADAQKTMADQVLLSLYQQLFEPLDLLIAQQPFEVDHLAIVPDQFLFPLPWAALYNGHTYLGELYQIDLYPSALSPILVKEPSQTPKQNQNARLLGYQGKENPLFHLRQELSRIQACFMDAEVINPARTEHFVWDQSPSCLHIAAHGLLDTREPLFSSLEMADAYFLLADVFKLDLDGTDLVTLSACQTGVTPEQGGVVLALVGAFLCAGAQTVLSSLWSVDDQATQLLMSTFYQAWQNGQNVITALQTAQTHLRETGFTHPFYWAAFQPLSR